MRRPTSAARARPYRWAGVWCLGGMASIALTTTLLPVILPSAAVDLGGVAGLTYEQRGRLLASLTAGFVSALLWSGPLADRLGPKWFAVGGNVLVALGLGWWAVADSYAHALAAGAAAGTGAGVLDMVLSPLVARIHPDRSASALNRLHATFALAAVAASTLSAMLLRSGWPWARVMGLWTAVPVVVGTGFLVSPVPSLVHADEQAATVRELCGHPVFRRWALVLFGVGAMGAGVGQWLPALAQQSMGWGPSGGGAAMSLSLAGVGAARLLASRALKRLGAEPLLRGCVAATAILLGVAAAGVLWPTAGLAAAILAGPASGAMWPTVLAAASARIPGGGGALFGLLSAAGNTGCFVAPWVLGVAADWIGLRPALVLLLIPAALAWRAIGRAGVGAQPSVGRTGRVSGVG